VTYRPDGLQAAALSSARIPADGNPKLGIGVSAATPESGDGRGDRRHAATGRSL